MAKYSTHRKEERNMKRKPVNMFTLRDGLFILCLPSNIIIHNTLYRKCVSYKIKKVCIICGVDYT